MVWITDRLRDTIITQLTGQNKSLSRNESQIFWRFPCVTRNNKKTKNAKTYMLLFERLINTWCGVQVLTSASASQASFRLSSFWLSVHLSTDMQFISEFIWVNLMRSHNFILVRTWSARSARTNQRLKSADLRHRQKPSRRLGSTLGLGRVIKDDWKELQACCHLYF